MDNTDRSALASVDEIAAQLAVLRHEAHAADAPQSTRDLIQRMENDAATLRAALA